MGAPPLRPIRSASVLMPTWQGIEFLERVLDALAAQQAELPWDLHVIDSGSTDGTWECLQARRASFPVPLRVRRIRQGEFDHGDTRNELAARSAGDLLVFLTQDAIPSAPDWLARLARNFAAPEVGAAYCRNVARADAELLTRIFCRSDPGYAEARVEARLPDPWTWAKLGPDERRLLYNFNDVASAVRRELWERHPFPRTTMGEDVLIARAIVEAGYAVVYDAQATVDHSHDYGPEKLHWRGEVDGRFNAEWFGRICVASEADAEVLTERLAAGDLAALAELGTPAAELERLAGEIRERRGALVRGLLDGGRSPRRYPRTALRESGRLGVLLVAHEAAASAQGALGLARALRARGQRAGLLLLAPAEPGGRFGIERDDRSGVRVLRASLAGGSGVLAAALQGVLASEQPDVVHFLTLGPALLELARAARGLGLATLASLDGAGEPRERGELEAAAEVDLRLCSDEALRRAWLGASDLDPQTLALCTPRAADSASSAELALELEFRYRALACIVRSDEGDGPLFEASGARAQASGAAQLQGPDWLLLRPGSAAEYPLASLAAGPLALELEQYALAAEPHVVLAGRALVDGVEVGRFAPQQGFERDQVVRQTIEFELPAGAARLRLEPHGAPEGAEPAHLRVCRVAAMRPHLADRLRRARGARPAGELARLAEELRVTPGPAPARSAFPRVAVVIPNLDGRGVLPDCLASLAALDYDRERLDVVLVDNGSRDGSAELAGELLPGIRVLRLPRNLGFAAACNAGARAAQGAGVLAFLNNDMRFEPDFLRELAAPLARGECAAATARILGWDGSAIDTSGTGTTVLGIAVQPGYGQPQRPEHGVPRKTLFGCGGAMAVDAAVFADVGGFDEEFFAYYEDLDLGWRMWVQGHEVHYVPSALCYHRHSHTSQRFPPEVVRLVMIRNSLLTCVKNYDDENLARILPALLALAIRRAQLHSGIDPAPLRIQAASLADPPGSEPEPGWLARLRRRAEAWLGRETGAQPARATLAIEPMGAADLVAIDDLLSNWDHWMHRRREVQARRRRGDDEIQRLFLEPLACVEGDRAYADLQSALFAMYGLDRAFARS